MKFKKLYIFLGLILAIGVLQSCLDDFLEFDPKMDILESNAYNTEEDAYAALVAVYQALVVQNWVYVPIMGDIFSDDAYCAGEPGGGMQQWADQEYSIIDAENSAASDFWNKCYSGNYRANQFFNNEADIAWETPGLRERMHAEVLVLRAYFYWDLVRHYGWIPLISELIPDPESYKSISQSSPDEVYNFIVSDLLAAMPNLPNKATAAESGRVTADMVRVLLARIYMYYEGFAKPVFGLSGDLTNGSTVVNKAYVQGLLEEIINSGRYRLLDNYADVFAWDNEWNAESIFEWQYDWQALSSDWGGWGIAGNFAIVFYGVRDPSGDPTLAPGWSFGVPTWDLVNEFEDGDPRLEVSIYDANANLTGYTRGYQNTGYFNNKYMPLEEYRSTAGGDPNHNWQKNYIDMRYADVLLMAAELWLGQDNAKALNYLNQVRERAMPGAGLSSIDLDAIYHERRVELSGEGHRKWDLLRRGLDYAKTEIDESWDVPDGIPNPNEFIGREFRTNTWGMLPIPAGEIRLANEGVLEQFVPAFQ